MFKRRTLIPLLAVPLVLAITPSLASAWAPIRQATVSPG
jgi:multidrug efflux pump subunit AcrB